MDPTSRSRQRPAALRVVVSVLAALVLGSCAARDREGALPADCADRADNDADGLFDCDDPDCDGVLDCSEMGDDDSGDDDAGDDDSGDDDSGDDDAGDDDAGDDDAGDDDAGN